jgi:hypothetical protein
MMTLRARRVGISAAGVAAIHGFAFLLAGSAIFARAPAELGLGLVVDLTLTATLLVYLVAVRPGHLPAVALLPVFAAGALTARVVVPEEGRAALVAVGLAALAVEAGAATLLVVRLRRVVARHRLARRAGRPPRAALEEALAHGLGAPLVAAVLATELVMLHRAVVGWFRRAPRDEGAFFAVHRKRAWSVIAATLVFLTVVETVVVHLLLSRVSPVAAWVVTALSGYGLLWILGDAHALRLGGIHVTDDRVVAEIGLRWRFEIPRAALRSVTRIEAKLPRAKDVAACELLWPNVHLELSEPVVVAGPFGITKRVRHITLAVDRESDFLSVLGPLPDPTQAL